MNRLNIIHSEYLKDAGGSDWKDKAMTVAIGTYYSDKIKVQFSRGYTALLVLTSAGTLKIDVEVSIDDGQNWYTPYDTDGNDLGAIVSGLTANKWIVFDPQITVHIRFKFVLTDTNSTISAKYIQQE